MVSNKQNQKVLIVANVTWNVYNFRLNLIEALLSEGFEVHLAAVQDQYTSFLKDFPDVQFTPLKRLYRTSKNPVKDLLFLQELHSVYSMVNPDMAIHYTIKPNIYAGIIAQVKKVPYFSVVTGLGYSFIHKGWLESLTEALYKIGMNQSAQVVFENEDDKMLFIEKGIIKPSNGKAVKGCGVDTEHFRLSSQRKPNKTTFVFSYIGRLLYDKGLSEIIDAFKKIRLQNPSVELWLIGKRDLENPACISEKDFAAWIEMEGVFYKGYTEDVRPFIERSDCIVYPSYREGMPKLVLEALCMETPIITTDVAGCRETIVDGEHGFIVPERNSEALRLKMQAMLHLDFIDRLHMGLKGRIRAEELFKDTKIARDLMAIIHLGMDQQKLLATNKRHQSYV